MQRHFVVPDAITYNTLICVCEKGKQLEQALTIFKAL